MSPLYALVLFVPALVGIAAGPLYALVVRNGRPPAAIALLSALLAWGIVLTPAIAYTTLSGFGPGTLLSFLLFPLALLSFLALLVALPLGWTQRYNLATGNWSTVDFGRRAQFSALK